MIIIIQLIAFWVFWTIHVFHLEKNLQAIVSILQHEVLALLIVLYGLVLWQMINVALDSRLIDYFQILFNQLFLKLAIIAYHD